MPRTAWARRLLPEPEEPMTAASSPASSSKSRAEIAVMLITHDLPLALTAADRVTVFYAGLTMETARKADFAEGGRGLRHPYTRSLWEALPQNRFTPLPGFQPPAGALPGPCAFYPRCPDADADCLRPVPLRELRGGTVRCIHAA